VVPVNEQAIQLALPFDTAEVSAEAETVAELDPSPKVSESCAEPKSEDKYEYAELVTMESATRFLAMAFQKVASNKGAAGPDGRSLEEVRKHLPKHVRSERAGTRAMASIKAFIEPETLAPG
jgi:hypothetical protein